MENRIYRGMLLPPQDLTPCGRLTWTPEQFYNSACEEADRLLTEMGMNPESSIVDIGCGVGRLPIGLLARQHQFGGYLGIDVDPNRIRWCQNHLAVGDSRLKFQHLDVRNERYNPAGAQNLAVPIPDRSVDIIYLYSVFSHLLQKDVEEYLSIFSRILKSSGCCFVTMFVADGVPPCTENPQDFGPLKWEGRLHCILYSSDNWNRMLQGAKLRISKVVRNVNIDGQTGFYIVRL
jgi:SAM-dependent methyltransferase